MLLLRGFGQRTKASHVFAQGCYRLICLVALLLCPPAVTGFIKGALATKIISRSFGTNHRTHPVDKSERQK